MVSVACPHDRVADWELWLAAAAQHRRTVLYGLPLARGKVKIQNLKYGFY